MEDFCEILIEAKFWKQLEILKLTDVERAWIGEPVSGVCEFWGDKGHIHEFRIDGGCIGTKSISHPRQKP